MEDETYFDENKHEGLYKSFMSAMGSESLNHDVLREMVRSELETWENRLSTIAYYKWNHPEPNVRDFYRDYYRYIKFINVKVRESITDARARKDYTKDLEKFEKGYILLKKKHGDIIGHERVKQLIKKVFECGKLSIKINGASSRKLILPPKRLI